MTKDTDKTEGAQPVTDERLDEIEARARAATDRPWVLREHRYSKHVYGPSGRCVVDVRGSEDGEFIAHARQDVPDLVAEVRRLRAKLEGDQ